MKAPKPRPPKGAPPGTVWFGGPIQWTAITFRVQGVDLDPEDVSRVLGCEPDLARRRGDPILRSDGSTGRLARTGAWHLELTPDQTDEWDCGEAIHLMMRRLPSDLEVWKRLAGRFAIDVYVSLTMTSINKGFSLSPEVLRYLGEREIEVGFDILHDEEKEAEPGTSAPNTAQPGRFV